jgi:hypothetical protein
MPMIPRKEPSRMVMIALCSSLIGAVVGTRFKVQVLFPTAVLGIVTVAAAALYKGSTMSWATLAVIVCVTSLQIGYLAGLFTRFCMAASRMASHRSLRSTAARS